MGRSQDTWEAAAASLPALRKCAGVGSGGNSRGPGAALLETCGKRGMSVSRQASSTAARLARWLLGCAVRHWPEETRPWGLALAAEIDETAGAFETVRWSLGGMMFFARSVLLGAWAWLKLPAGGSLPSGAEGPSMLPKRSREFTAGILILHFSHQRFWI